MNHQGLALAKDTAHPLNIVIAGNMSAGHYHLRREPLAALAVADESIKTANDYSLFYRLAVGKICKGWALSMTGRVDEGISLLREGLRYRELSGARADVLRFLGMLIEAYLAAGKVKEGLASVEEALIAREETEDRFYRPELYRLKGELLLNRKRPGVRLLRVKEAETCFLKAIEVASEISAKSLELRATISLCRLWKEAKEKKKAQKRLHEIYGFFTEDFDTPDLKEARFLLEELQ